MGEGSGEDTAGWEADDGQGLGTRLLGAIRAHLPVREFGTASGVRVPAPAEPRRLVDGVLSGVQTPEHLPFEGALASVHREYTHPDDRVVIVGGGFGITTALAARAGADVTVFEPDPTRRDALRRTLRLNGIDADAVDHRDAVVGELNAAEAEGKGLDPAATQVVKPADLPTCDVLELDCEGAEGVVLAGLAPPDLPRVLAVEIHPIKLDGRTGPVLDRLADLGYEIDARLTHDGHPLDEAAFAALLEGETPSVADPDHQTFPPVVVAIRDGSD